MSISTDNGIVMINSGLGSDMFNIICTDSHADKKSVKIGIDYFQQKQLPFCWWVGFDHDSDWLKDSLSAHQLHPSEEELMMVAKSDQISWEPPPTELELKRVTGNTHIDDLIKVICQVVDSPEHHAMHTFFHAASPYLISPDTHLHFFIGYVDQQPVACSSVFFSQGIASIFDVMVSPAMREKGLGKAMTFAAMKEGADSGYSDLILTATDGAKFLYEKMGFKKVKMMSVYNLHQ
jgi:ribosomal protein S18 acetylase RimI-like enzyme